MDQARTRFQALVQFLPVRNAGWTEDQAHAFVERMNRRARNATERLLNARPAGQPVPKNAEDMMLHVEWLMSQHRVLITEPEKRAIRFWHKLVREFERAQNKAS